MNVKLDHIYLIFFYSIISISSMNAQSKNPITISYFGETITHPGLYIGSEKNIVKSLYLELGVGTYLHYNHHRGLFLKTNLNWRKTFDSGYSMQYGLGLGYLHTFDHGGKIFSVDDQGNVSEKSNNGSPSLMPCIKLGVLGWDLRKKTDIPIRIFTEIEIFGQYPHNNFIMPHFSLNIGGTYYL